MYNILIVEDDNNKCKDVVAQLKDLGILDSSLTIATNVRDALNALRSNVFDVLILDMNLPLYADSTTNNTGGGYNIIQKLKREEYKMPTTILALTSYGEVLEEYEELFRDMGIFLLSYANDLWRSSLISAVERSRKAVRQHAFPSAASSGGVVTILVHGVNTTGQWQKDITSKLEALGHKVVPFEYRYYSPFKIMLPWFRKSQLNWFKKQFEKVINENRGSQFNIICHSFGTYLGMKSMQNTYIDDVCKFKSIILMGSVLPRKFDFSEIERKFSPDIIVNECGINDMPLVFCKMFCFGLGNAGRLGFHTSSVKLKNRYFSAGHSVFNDVDAYYDSYLHDYFVGGELKHQNSSANVGVRGFIESILDTFNPFVVYSSMFIIVYNILN